MARRILPQLRVEVRQGAAIGRLEQLTSGRPEALRPVLERLGIMLVAQAERAFDQQRLGNQQWPGRINPNVPAIVRDMNEGRSPPRRRFVDRPANVDTGRTRQSLAYRVTGRRVIVGAGTEYSARLQKGGKVTIELTGSGRRNLAKFLRRRRDLRKALGWLFSRPTFKLKVRARPFLGLTADTRRKAERELAAFVRGRGGK